MATKFRLRRSATADKRPVESDLLLGELALNTYDGRLYTKRDTNNVGIADTAALLTPWTENFGGGSIFYSNSVGIGSEIPTDILDIQTGSSDEVTKFKVKIAGQLELTRNHASAPYIKTFMDSGDPEIRLGDSSGDKAVIKVDGVSYFNGGNVGINSTTPEKKLDITGNLQVKDAGGKIGLLLDPSTGDFQVNQSVASWTNTGIDPVALLRWGWKGATGNYMYMGSGGNDAVANQMALLISGESGFKVGRSAWDGTDGDISSSNEFFRITKTGNVGIGSALPDYMLDVSGAINSETDVKVGGVSVSETALNDAVAMAIALG